MGICNSYMYISLYRSSSFSKEDWYRLKNGHAPLSPLNVNKNPGTQGTTVKLRYLDIEGTV